MLEKFLKKNQPQDQREHYRRRPGKASALGVKLICESGAPVAGTLLDLSAGGTAIEFEDDMTGELVMGAVREVVFSSLTQRSVRAYAEVRLTASERTPKRYGFQFLNGHELFEQLDESFYKYFNRRQYRRAKPGLGDKVKADLLIGNVQESVAIYDLSIGGASFYVAEDIAANLEVGVPVELTIRVPKTPYELTHYAIVRHVTPEGNRMRIGVSMEVVANGQPKRTVRKAQTAYTDYLQKRIAEMDRYNSAYN